MRPRIWNRHTLSGGRHREKGRGIIGLVPYRDIVYFGRQVSGQSHVSARVLYFWPHTTHGESIWIQCVE
jgi:hypothetical protein